MHYIQTKHLWNVVLSDYAGWSYESPNHLFTQTGGCKRGYTHLDRQVLKPLKCQSRSHLFHRPENVPAFIEAVKKMWKGTLSLSGFGHHVYKTVWVLNFNYHMMSNVWTDHQSDPRSFTGIVWKTADDVFKMCLPFKKLVLTLCYLSRH